MRRIEPAPRLSQPTANCESIRRAILLMLLTRRELAAKDERTALRIYLGLHRFPCHSRLPSSIFRALTSSLGIHSPLRLPSWMARAQQLALHEATVSILRSWLLHCYVRRR